MSTPPPRGRTYYDGYDPDEIRKNLRVNSSQSVMTLVSIILSVALGLTVSKMGGLLLDNCITPASISNALLVFTAIFLNFYYYQNHVSFYTIPPTLLYTLAPLLIGTTTALMAVTIGSGKLFHVTLLLFLTSSSFAFSLTDRLTYLQKKQLQRKYKEVHELKIKEASKNLNLTLIFAYLQFMMILCTFVVWSDWRITSIAGEPLMVTDLLSLVVTMIIVYYLVKPTERNFLKAFPKITAKKNRVNPPFSKVTSRRVTRPVIRVKRIVSHRP